MITSSIELQTPAPSPARLATPHTDISTESGLNTGNPDKEENSQMYQSIIVLC